MDKTVVAIFDNHKNAESAALQMKERGLKTDDISIITKDTSEAQDNLGEQPTQSMGTSDNISSGVVSGGILGGIAGVLLGAGTIFIPGLGIIAAAGPIAGLVSGAITGGIVGGLIDLGIPESESRQYESNIKEGKVLFSMKADGEKLDQVSDVLQHNGAISIDNY